jgi:catechol 2,3-dioxygenase-like lactoylglutathione lyase family enzyme
MSHRFHVHLHVADLAQSIGFYSKLFAAEPTRRESDYAKWMLADPPVNFAISTRGPAGRIDHLGIQTDNADDLAALQSRARSADLALEVEGETSCCYARSDKHWVTDPQGVAWEHFHTLGDIPTFGGEPSAHACCPAPTGRKAVPIAVKGASSACC